MKNLLIAAICIIQLNFAKAQMNFDFNNRHLSQSAIVNPGFLPQHKFTMGFNSFNSLNLNGFNLNSIFNKFESDSQTARNLMNSSEKQMGIDLLSNTNLFHFGIRSKKAYFTYTTSLVFEGQINAPKDIFGLATFGNSAFIGKEAKIDFSNTNFTSYVKNEITYGRQITNELSVGVNLGLINGLANMQVDKAYLGLQTDTGVNSIYQFKATAEANMRASMLGFDLTLFSDSAYQNNRNKTIIDQLGKMTISSNQGLSFGTGFVYRINEKFRVSGSVQNLGKIVWDILPTEHKLFKGQWTFTGLDTGQTNNLSKDIAKQIIDTLNLKFQGSSAYLSSYTTYLKPRYTLGLEFFPFKRTNIQLVGGYGFGYTGDKAFVSAAVHQEIGEVVDIRASYCKYDFQNSQNRVSLGMSLNLGVIQPYFNINDAWGAAEYAHTNNISGTIGLNIYIGTQKDRDNDGVPDKRDSCRKVFGVMSNNGCPYGFLGESMNGEEEMTQATPQLEEAPKNPEPEPTPTPKTETPKVVEALTKAEVITSEPVKEITPVKTVVQNETAKVEPIKTVEVAPKVETVPVTEIKTNQTGTVIKRSKNYQLYVNEMTDIMKK